MANIISNLTQALADFAEGLKDTTHRMKIERMEALKQAFIEHNPDVEPTKENMDKYFKEIDEFYDMLYKRNRHK